MSDRAAAQARTRAPSIDERVASLPWDRIVADLDARGVAVTGPLLTPEECRGLAALYDEPSRFRSRVVMARHGFGSGEYRYFARPLPALVGRLREAAYPHLVPVAAAWAERSGEPHRFPPDLEGLAALCLAAGQGQPTPLLLRYGPDDHNCLHQDLYGDVFFPLQLSVLLSAPGEDFTGGEFVVCEQRPRRQSRVEVVPMGLGEGAVFAVHHRPVEGARGPYRATLRHGVSRIREGRRMALGVIFHDAA